LIRTSEDHGNVHILLNEEESSYIEVLRSILPVEVDTMNV
jgi:ATP-dependent DNA helicase DinG